MQSLALGPVRVIHFNPERVIPTDPAFPEKTPLNNFGDVLGPELVRRILISRGITWDPDVDAAHDLLSVGSILHFSRPGAHVWGSGVNGKALEKRYRLEGTQVHAVRGPRTRAFLQEQGLQVPEVYGDPGLLCAQLFPREELGDPLFRSDVTIVPNFHDYPAVAHLPNVLNPRTPLEQCLATLAHSRFVIGSSLHGTVVAEAYGVPARPVASDVEPEFKYRDYLEGTGRPQAEVAKDLEEAQRLGPLPAPEFDADALLAAFPAHLWEETGSDAPAVAPDSAESPLLYSAAQDAAAAGRTEPPAPAGTAAPDRKAFSMSTLSGTIRRGLSVGRRIARKVTSQGPVQKTAEPAATNPAVTERRLFIGHTRFSVHQHGSGYFNATRDSSRGAGFSEKEYTDWLYSDARLAPRTEIFTQLSLPQLAKAAEHHDVVHFVSFSPSLPQEHKQQLIDAAQKYDFLELNETKNAVSSTPSKTLVRRALQKHNVTDAPFGVYRLDDDDLLSVNYFSQMAPYVTPKHIGWWVSLGSGISAIRMDGEFTFARDYYYPKSAFGPMAICAQDTDGEILNLKAPKHTILDQYNPTIIDSREPAFFHIRHESQDSTVEGEVRPFYPEAMGRILSEGPADLDKVAELFPLVADKTTLTPGPEGRDVQLQAACTLERPGLDLSWDQQGPLSLQVVPAGGKSLKPNQIQVRLTLDIPESQREVHQKFLSAAKLRHSERDGTYWRYMPNKSSGFGHVLPIEPPAGVNVTSVRLVPDKAETIELDEVVGYPLPRRRA